jgi:hypothetical protein
LTSSAEFKTQWHDVTIPLNVDLIEEMKKGLDFKSLTLANLKPMQVYVAKQKSAGSGGKTKKRKGNRFKMTNLHLASLGVDLTKDYANPNA